MVRRQFRFRIWTPDSFKKALHQAVHLLATSSVVVGVRRNFFLRFFEARPPEEIVLRHKIYSFRFDRFFLDRARLLRVAPRPEDSLAFERRPCDDHRREVDAYISDGSLVVETKRHRYRGSVCVRAQLYSFYKISVTFMINMYMRSDCNANCNMLIF